MEILNVVNSLGLPGWAIIIVVLVIVLHYTGTLKSLGDLTGSVISNRQRVQNDLIGKALDNQTFFVNYITDRQDAELEDIKDSLKDVKKALVDINTHQRIIVHLLEDVNRVQKTRQDSDLFKLVSELQERIAEIENASVDKIN